MRRAATAILHFTGGKHRADGALYYAFHVSFGTGRVGSADHDHVIRVTA